MSDTPADDRAEYLDRAINSLKRAVAGSSQVVGSCDTTGMILHVKRGTDPAELVHIARSLLEQAVDWMDEDHDGQDGEDAGGVHPLYGAVTECVELLTEPDDDGDDA